jgi:mono/diheme cytochrome c family protein
MATTRLVAWVFSAFCATACGGAQEEPKAANSAATETSAATEGAAGDQADVGAKLYGANCADCHGADGKGNAKAPPVVGSNALPLDAQPPSKLRNTQFHTALDVLQFIQANMPPKHPGSLTQAEYEAILAFDLKANGVDLTGKQVTASNAATFVLHP